MLDVDTVSTFMISIVTNYCASCGDSLETILNDPTDCYSTCKTKASSAKKETPVFNQHFPDPVIAYSVDGMTICHSIGDVDNDKEPFEIQKINGTDMIFFPRPSSEMSFSRKHLIRKKRPPPLPEIQGQRTTSTSIDDKVRQGELENRSPHRGEINHISAKNASKWIAMGLIEGNIKNSIPLHHDQRQRQHHSTHQNHHKHHQEQHFPFDEMKIENSKRPLTIRPQSRFQTLTPTKKKIARSCTTMTGAQVNRAQRIDLQNNCREVRTSTSGTASLEGVHVIAVPTDITNFGRDEALLIRAKNIIAIRKLDAPLNNLNHRHKIHNRKMSSHWKSAVDPRSGQTYFFHELTRETQWRKPMELATNEERSTMEQKEQKEKDFFAAMEANILSSLSRGVIPGTADQDESESTATDEDDLEGTSEGERKVSGIESRYSFRKSFQRRRSRAGRPELVRTISTMDESVLTDVIRRQPSFRSVKSGLSKREPSIQLEGSLREFIGGSRSVHSRDGFDSLYSSSQGSHSSILETLEEDASESSRSVTLDLMPDLRGSLKNSDARILERSMSSRDDLNYEETQALNKLFSLTKEMMDADKERPNNDDEFSQPATAIAGLGEKIDPARTLRRVTDTDVGRTLPRERELGDSDGKKEKPKSQTISRKEKASRMLANSGKRAADLLHSRVQGVQRRNTCGTMYIRTTMSAPDKDATIRCVCGVYRSHIISSQHSNLGIEETESLNVFNDYPNDAHAMQSQNPTLDEITTFYRDIFYKAQMEADCIIMSLIYVERLIKKTNGNLRPRATNWRSLLFSCMILSSKVWDDLSMWNADFSQSCPPGGVNFSLQRINQLELAILNTLKFNVKVLASEYAKYYFLLRSMLIKSGLGGEDLGSLDPLDVEGARKLQQVSSEFESVSLMKSGAQRSKSLAVQSNLDATLFRQPKTKVGLEQVVKM